MRKSAYLQPVDLLKSTWSKLVAKFQMGESIQEWTK